MPEQLLQASIKLDISTTFYLTFLDFSNSIRRMNCYLILTLSLMDVNSIFYRYYWGQEWRVTGLWFINKFVSLKINNKSSKDDVSFWTCTKVQNDMEHWKPVSFQERRRWKRWKITWGTEQWNEGDIKKISMMWTTLWCQGKVVQEIMIYTSQN